MTNLSPEICFRLKAARRNAKVGQQELAREVGCKQSAISMFENGNPTKLSEETVKKIAAKFGVLLSGDGSEEGAETLEAGGVAGTGYCSNPACPSNKAYEVDGRRLFVCNREMSDPAGGKFCAMCGEVLARRCPNCGAPVHAGAVCSICGEAYISL